VSPVEKATVFETNVTKEIVSMSTSKKLREIPDRAKKMGAYLKYEYVFCY
jgi:hypothetical protein